MALASSLRLLLSITYILLVALGEVNIREEYDGDRLIFYFRGGDNTTYDLNTFINTTCEGKEQKDIITTWAPADAAANAALENVRLPLSAAGLLSVEIPEDMDELSADVDVFVIDSCGGNATLYIALILTNATDETLGNSNTTAGESSEEDSVNATGPGSPSLAPSLAPTDNRNTINNPSLSPTVLTPIPPTPSPGVVALYSMLDLLRMYVYADQDALIRLQQVTHTHTHMHAHTHVNLYASAYTCIYIYL
jgi:hypothetical protein